MIIKGDQNYLSGGQFFIRLSIDDILFDRHGLVSQFAGAHPDFDEGAVLHRRMEGDARVCQNNTDIHKGLSRLEKPQVDKIIDTRCLEVSQVLGVIQVTLRVQVAVADFDGVEEAEFGHRANYTV